jgi:hypothetical protein
LGEAGALGIALADTLGSFWQETADKMAKAKKKSCLRMAYVL